LEEVVEGVESLGGALDFEEDAGGVIEDAAGDAGGGGDAVDEGPEADALDLAADMPAVAEEVVGWRRRKLAGHALESEYWKTNGSL
jgi:hypothetical protein